MKTIILTYKGETVNKYRYSEGLAAPDCVFGDIYIWKHWFNNKPPSHLAIDVKALQ